MVDISLNNNNLTISDSGQLSLESGITTDTNSSSLFDGSLKMYDNRALLFGTGSDCGIFYSTTQSTDTLISSVPTSSRGWIICENGDSGFEWGHAQQTNPTVFIHSANQATDEWIGFYHNQTAAVIESGSGNLTFIDPVTGTVTLADLSSGGTLDAAYNGGNTIDVDGDPVTLTVSDTDNNSALSLVQNDTSNNPTVLDITNAGTGDSISLVGGGTIGTTANGNLNLIPNGTGYTIIGDAGSTSHSLGTNDDLFVTGKLEVDGNAYFDGIIYQNGNSYLGTEDAIYFGGGGINVDSKIFANTATDQWLFCCGDNEGNQIVITNSSNSTSDHDHATTTNPTLFIHSDTDPDSDPDQYISIYHDQTDGNIDCALGTLNLGATGNVNFAGASVTASTVEHDAYVELEVAGTLYKFMLGTPAA